MATEKRNRRLLWMVAGSGLIAAAVVTASFFWPPASRDMVQGMIGKRDVYRQAQLSDKDIGVAGTRPVTIDDVRRLVQSPEFKALASDARFKLALEQGQFGRLLDSPALRNLKADPAMYSILGSTAFQQAVLQYDLQQVVYSSAVQDKIFAGLRSMLNARAQASTAVR